MQLDFELPKHTVCKTRLDHKNRWECMVEFNLSISVCPYMISFDGGQYCIHSTRDKYCIEEEIIQNLNKNLQHNIITLGTK